MRREPVTTPLDLAPQVHLPLIWASCRLGQMLGQQDWQRSLVGTGEQPVRGALSDAELFNQHDTEAPWLRPVGRDPPVEVRVGIGTATRTDTAPNAARRDDA